MKRQEVDKILNKYLESVNDERALSYFLSQAKELGIEEIINNNSISVVYTFEIGVLKPLLEKWINRLERPVDESALIDRGLTLLSNLSNRYYPKHSEKQVFQLFLDSYKEFSLSQFNSMHNSLAENEILISSITKVHGIELHAKLSNAYFFSILLHKIRSNKYKALFKTAEDLGDEISGLIDVYVHNASEDDLQNYNKLVANSNRSTNQRGFSFSIKAVLTQLKKGYRIINQIPKSFKAFMSFNSSSEEKELMFVIREFLQNLSFEEIKYLPVQGLDKDIIWIDNISKRRKFLGLADILSVAYPNEFDDFESWCQVHKTGTPKEYEEDRIRKVRKILKL